MRVCACVRMMKRRACARVCVCAYDGAANILQATRVPVRLAHSYGLRGRRGKGTCCVWMRCVRGMRVPVYGGRDPTFIPFITLFVGLSLHARVVFCSMSLQVSPCALWRVLLPR